ncbi:twin-arginine translocase TatA/TatE family subunit [Aquipuribacter nitratireducens]|uniref:Sec-independent protein translocase protein TatB n=1 Tax=Aquipuribacter nitratireducens TaxID=650104 RepID=A0ABW0GQW3_9MICO
MPDINGGEFLVIALVAMLLLGPDRLPELARQAARLVRRARDFATGASAQMKDEIGVDLDRVDWRRYDPRQYHPRRIVRNALSDVWDDDDTAAARPGATAATPGGVGKASSAAAKRAEAVRRPAGQVAPAGQVGTSAAASRSAAGPGPAARGAGRSAPRPSPPPTTWAEAARRAGVDDDAT